MLTMVSIYLRLRLYFVTATNVVPTPTWLVIIQDMPDLRKQPSGYLFFARSEKAFYSPFRNSDGGFSGLTVDEGRFCYLLSHTRLKNLEHGIPLAKFEVYDNEWIKTTLEQVNAARKNPSNKTLAARLAAFGENTDEALGAILSMTDDYSITVGALKKTLDTRKRSWNSE
ncbi:hypothetical protein FOZ62_001699 [Perkinsus olseni]|uniref:Uncharacterized protein n=1 Tax=Perkinsus olseni TaxID=32597 RepID=A0A7J6S637_PEROL|nr:hypothetical protein FOZ62_001699 [Perkinsus olseni]